MKIILIYKNDFICMIIKNHFHKKGFVLGLVLKQRLHLRYLGLFAYVDAKIISSYHESNNLVRLVYYRSRTATDQMEAWAPYAVGVGKNKMFLGKV